MNEYFKTAVSELLVEPCKTYRDRTVHAANASTDAERRMAITMIEDHLRMQAGGPNTYLADTLIQLRRAGA